MLQLFNSCRRNSGCQTVMLIGSLSFLFLRRIRPVNLKLAGLKQARGLELLSICDDVREKVVVAQKKRSHSLELELLNHGFNPESHYGDGSTRWWDVDNGHVLGMDPRDQNVLRETERCKSKEIKEKESWVNKLASLQLPPLLQSFPNSPLSPPPTAAVAPQATLRFAT